MESTGFDIRPTSPTVSIVVPTYNRLTRLQRCVAKVAENVTVDHELIVVDGGSTDGSREFLADQSHIRTILEEKREGAVRGFNKGFQAATGAYVMWLNDDAYPLPGSVASAVAMIERHDDIGMVAFYHDWDRERNVLDTVLSGGKKYRIYNVRGFPYANFGLIRRELLEAVGFADERYYFFAFDPDLSLKVQIEAGMKVIGCRDALICHEEYHDERKLDDLSTGEEDNQLLFAKWQLPQPFSYPDPGPAYRKLAAGYHRSEQATPV